jgi:hypothetical protein
MEVVKHSYQVRIRIRIEIRFDIDKIGLPKIQYDFFLGVYILQMLKHTIFSKF